MFLLTAQINTKPTIGVEAPTGGGISLPYAGTSSLGGAVKTKTKRQASATWLMQAVA